MNKIIYIGMDVHSTNFTLCSFEPAVIVKVVCDTTVKFLIKFTPLFFFLLKEKRGGEGEVKENNTHGYFSL